MDKNLNQCGREKKPAFLYLAAEHSRWLTVAKMCDKYWQALVMFAETTRFPAKAASALEPPICHSPLLISSSIHIPHYRGWIAQLLAVAQLFLSCYQLRMVHFLLTSISN